MKLRFVELDPDRIFNWLHPKNVTCWHNVQSLHSTWWSEETLKQRERFAEVWMEAFDGQTGHFSKLRDSISKDGIKFPISTVSGVPRCKFLKEELPIESFPPHIQIDPSVQIYSHTFGGSRLTIAQELGIESIPCIVYDFNNLFNDAKEINAGNYKTWFGGDYNFVNQTPNVRIKSQCHLQNTWYDSFNIHTRDAQKHATKAALEAINV